MSRMSRRQAQKEASRVNRIHFNKDGLKNFKNIDRKKIMIIAAVIAVLYILISIYFRSHYYFGTKIEGISCGGKNADAVKELIKESMQDYSIKISERGYRQEEITADQVKLTFVDDGRIDEILDNQMGIAWLFSVFMDLSYEGYTVSVDDDAYLETVNSLDMMQEENIVEPQDATAKYDRGTELMMVMIERQGTALNQEEFLSSLKKAILNRDDTFDVEEKECYKSPEVTSDSTELASKITEMNVYCQAKITYDFDDRTEVVDGSDICKWIYFSDDGKAHIDEECVQDYVSELAEKYDTVGKTRKFKAISGNWIEVSGGTYGWTIDQEDETAALLDDVEEGRKVKREPDYSHIAKSRKRNDVGDTYVDVDLSAQYCYAYKDGEIVTEGSVVTGNISLGRGTPDGSYYIIGKDTATYLVGQGYRSYVNFWMPITDTGIGLHDAPWRGYFGGSIYVYSGSHGCINMPYYLASEIYNSIEATYPVIVHW